MEFYQTPLDDIYHQFETQSSGLASEEAARRLEIHGFNELQTRIRINGEYGKA